MKKARPQKRINHKKLEEMFRKYGYSDYEWIAPRNIGVSRWVRMKWSFGCKSYDRSKGRSSGRSRFRLFSGDEPLRLSLDRLRKLERTEDTEVMLAGVRCRTDVLWRIPGRSSNSLPTFAARLRLQGWGCGSHELHNRTIP